MYRLEITTADDRESLLYTEEIQTWTELTEAIKFYQSLEFDIAIRVFKGINDNCKFIGDFTNIKPRQYEKEKIKKLKLSTKIIILEILLFPVMLLKEILKDQ